MAEPVVETWDDPEPWLRLGQIWTAHRAGEDVSRADVAWLIGQVDYLVTVRASRVDPVAVKQRWSQMNGLRHEMFAHAMDLVAAARRGRVSECLSE